MGSPNPNLIPPLKFREVNPSISDEQRSFPKPPDYSNVNLDIPLEDPNKKKFDRDIRNIPTGDIKNYTSPENTLIELQKKYPLLNPITDGVEAAAEGRLANVVDANGNPVRNARGRIQRTRAPIPYVGKVLAPLSYSLDYSDNLANGQSRPRAIRNSILENTLGGIGTGVGVAIGQSTPGFHFDDYIYSVGLGATGQYTGNYGGDLIDKHIFGHTDGFFFDNNNERKEGIRRALEEYK